MITIVYGPMGCGKTRNADQLRRFFAARRIVDGWPNLEDNQLRQGDLALTYLDPPYDVRGARCVSFDRAMRMMGDRQ